jgi:hypothetical protein
MRDEHAGQGNQSVGIRVAAGVKEAKLKKQSAFLCTKSQPGD